MTKNNNLKVLFVYFCFINFFAFADVYIDSLNRSYNYNKSIPYRTVAKVTYHQSYSQITLDDGSLWKASGRNSKSEVLSWYINDPIVIFPSPGGVHGEGYYLFNERRNARAYVDVSESIRPDKVNAFLLASVDLENLTIEVKNSSNVYAYFTIKNNQIDSLTHWKKNDCILLGWNKNLYNNNDTSFPYILININQADHIFCEFEESAYKQKEEI